MLIGGGIGLNRVTAAGDAYGILNGQFRPEFVADFSTDQYRAGGAGVALSDALTFSRAGNATMVDSDGLLKWAPHNLLRYSEQFDNAAWGKVRASIIENSAVAPDGTLTADKLVEDTSVSLSHQTQQTVSFSLNATYTLTIWAKAGERDFIALNIYSGAESFWTWFNLSNGSMGSVTGSPVAYSIQNAGNGWYKCSLSVRISSSGTPNFAIYVTSANGALTYTGDGTSGIYIWGAHLYRSDLGGMVNNPDRGDSYVPTTSAAVYLPRVGHHVWNGSAWVNEGLLLESEARTNLIIYSEDLTQWSNDWGGGTTIASDQETGPDGELSLYSCSATDDVNDGFNNGYGVTAETQYSFSIFVKEKDSSTFNVRMYDATGAATIAESTFTWASGVLTFTSHTSAPDNYEIEDWGGGLYRVSYTFATPVGCTNVNTVFHPAKGGGGAVGEGQYIGFVQLEAGSTPSSYIPTTGSTVTRAAETLTAASANLPWPTPKVIGPELVTNGTFDTGDLTGWVELGSPLITFPSGAVNVESTGTNDGIAQQLVGVAAGDVVWLNFNVSGSISYVFQNNSPDFASITNILPAFAIPTGVNELAFVAAHDDPFICFGTAASSGANFTIDNISVREIDPLAVSIAMEGRVTYADEDIVDNVIPYRLYLDADNFIKASLFTSGSSGTGEWVFTQEEGGTNDFIEGGNNTVSPGVNVPYNLASRHGSTFINGSVDGTALTANTTPTALPDLSSTDLQLGFDMMGTIKLFRVWSADLGDSGIAEASA